MAREQNSQLKEAAEYYDEAAQYGYREFFVVQSVWNTIITRAA